MRVAIAERSSITGVRLQSLSFLRIRRGFEAPAVSAGFDDLTVMGETIKQCGGHLGIPCPASVCMQTLRGAKDGWLTRWNSNSSLGQRADNANRFFGALKSGDISTGLPRILALSEARAAHEAIEGRVGIGSIVLKAWYRARLFLDTLAFTFHFQLSKFSTCAILISETEGTAAIGVIRK
jgi:hypothetical protein